MSPPLPKPHKDRGIEGMLARWYASNTGKSLDEFAKLARRVAGLVPPGAAVLEVAPGPGYFAIELAKLGPYSVTGLDISRTFVEMGSQRAHVAGVQIDFRQGSASAMPFDADKFDFLLCRAAFKNFGQPVEALQEMCRVLKPGARGLIIDLRRDASIAEINREVDGMGLGTVDRVITKLAFRFSLIKTAYTKEQFQYMLAQTHFRSVDIQESGMGFEVWMTK